MNGEVHGEVKSSRKLFSGVVFDVNEYEVELKQTNKYRQVIREMDITRQLVTKNPCVVALVKHTGNDKFILAKEFRIGAMKEEYGLVAGIVDEGETAWDAVVRELQEEVGYKPKMVKQIGESYSSSGYSNEFITYFYIEVDEDGKTSRDPDSDEIVIPEMMEMDALMWKIKFGDIKGNHVKACLLHYILDSERAI